jgi:hypothetical protein
MMAGAAYANVLQAVATIVRTEGGGALFNGLLLSLVKQVCGWHLFQGGVKQMWVRAVGYHAVAVTHAVEAAMQSDGGRCAKPVCRRLLPQSPFLPLK